MSKNKEIQEQLYAEHADLLYGYLYSRLGNQEEAEDICQEAFYRAFKHLKKFRKQASFKNWLFQIAKNLMADHWRKHYQLKTIAFEDYMDVPQESLPEDTEDDQEKQAIAQGILAELPQNYREVLEYRFLRNYTLKETAQALNISENNVKIRQYRALKKAQEYAQE